MFITATDPSKPIVIKNVSNGSDGRMIAKENALIQNVTFVRA